MRTFSERSMDVLMKVSGSMSADFLATTLQEKNSISGTERNQFVGLITFEQSALQILS